MKLPANFVRQLIVCVALSIAFYAAWVVYSGAGEVWDAARAIGATGWIVILGLSLLNYLLRFLRWDYYLRRLGDRVPRGVNLLAYLAGFGFTATPGKVGEAVRSVYLKPFGVGYRQSLAAFFVERLVDLLAMVVVASLAAYAYANMRWLVGLSLVIAIAVLWGVHSAILPRLMLRLTAEWRSERLRAGVRSLLDLLGSSSALLRSAPLLLGFLLGIVAWAAEGFALYVVVTLMGGDVTVALATGIYGIAILAGVVSFVPGGLGGTEVVMGTLLMLAGVDAPLAVSAVIVCRLATLWFAVGIGLACLAGLEAGRLAPRVGDAGRP